MPKVMMRKDGEGVLTCYIPKKDLEAKVLSIEFDTPEKWGGTFTIDDGEDTELFIEPMEPAPTLPIELRANKA
ncbi:NifT/FixU family protein [Magnetococcus marinus MC-1]|uniref:NifT/FixU family protein n=1 Tax=Magnetococcus marinus (strain ATCC BAA-1437 / JCM 17883 / MC-1) TaxID=156889 RepID=A0L6W7_MAGMM|nr:putative nitrogen fixation protein NifT [Magnetococcus marinus]ABK43710.1 NifT/FixU family protein [Magnetococcus marinus MC-1]